MFTKEKHSNQSWLQRPPTISNKPQEKLNPCENSKTTHRNQKIKQGVKNPHPTGKSLLCFEKKVINLLLYSLLLAITRKITTVSITTHDFLSSGLKKIKIEVKNS